jgi:dinuclear metal center YbgI/SA1388 family protein
MSPPGPTVVRLDDVVRFLDTTLDIKAFRDYAVNGLQVEGRPEVARVVTGVTANLALVEAAVAKNADLVVVHHGLFWGGGMERLVGSNARRIGPLLASHVSLAGYHLPLDKHPVLGNNAGLADALGLPAERRGFGQVRGVELGVLADFAVPITRAELLDRVQKNVCGGAAAPFVFAHGPERVRRVGLCTGAASDLLEAASEAGCDAFVTGELAERAGEIARELQITLVAAGHHATEVFGPQRLVGAIRAVFPQVDVEFINVPSPL